MTFICLKINRAESLCNVLIKNGWPAVFISGSIEQNKRNFAILQLKQFKCRILVSTDLVNIIKITLHGSFWEIWTYFIIF